MNNNKFKDKTVLVTGGDGFIGSYLVEALLKKDAKVVALTRSKYLKNLDLIKDRIDIVYQDLTKKESVNEISKLKPDYIFHLAGFIKSDSYENPTEILETNVMGTINVIEAAVRIPNLKRIFYFSTGEVYGECVYANEDHELNPSSIYATSKLTSEKILQVYSQKKKIPTTIIRLFNTYGPRKKDNAIYFFIKAALKDEEIIINGNGEQIRSFIYIDDLVDTCLLISSKDDSIDRIINIGGEEYLKVKDLAQKIKYLCNSNSKILFRNIDPGLRSFYSDNTLLKNEYGFIPNINIDLGLKLTIDWVRSML